jgi:hypothetical protein
VRRTKACACTCRLSELYLVAQADLVCSLKVVVERVHRRRKVCPQAIASRTSSRLIFLLAMRDYRTVPYGLGLQIRPAELRFGCRLSSATWPACLYAEL